MFVSCEIGLFPASIIGIPADPEQVLHWRKSPLKAYYPKGCDDASLDLLPTFSGTIAD
jgi:hypothetical protein